MAKELLFVRKFLSRSCAEDRNSRVEKKTHTSCGQEKLTPKLLIIEGWIRTCGYVVLRCHLAFFRGNRIFIVKHILYSSPPSPTSADVGFRRSFAAPSLRISQKSASSDPFCFNAKTQRYVQKIQMFLRDNSKYLHCNPRRSPRQEAHTLRRHPRCQPTSTFGASSSPTS